MDKEVWCVVTDSHRGLCYGLVTSPLDLVAMGFGVVEHARHIRYYEPASGRGLFSLATHGPGPKSEVTPAEDALPYALVRDVVRVLPCSAAAVARFAAQGWAS